MAVLQQAHQQCQFRLSDSWGRGFFRHRAHFLTVFIYSALANELLTRTFFPKQAAQWLIQTLFQSRPLRKIAVPEPLSFSRDGL